jgi:hypothetical protein
VWTAVLCLAVALWPTPASATDQTKPGSPIQDRFLSKRNVFLLCSSAAAIAADGFTTQRFLANPKIYETNPVARMFGNSRHATVSIDLVSFAGVAGAMYIAHRKHHSRLEWLIPSTVTTIETGFALHNTIFPKPAIEKITAGIDIETRQ